MSLKSLLNRIKPKENFHCPCCLNPPPSPPQSKMSLKCLAAQSIRKYNLDYQGQVTTAIKLLSPDSHSRCPSHWRTSSTCMDLKLVQIGPRSPSWLLQQQIKPWKTFDGFFLQNGQKNCGFPRPRWSFSSFVIQLISWQPWCCDIHIFKLFSVLSAKYTWAYIGKTFMLVQGECLTKKNLTPILSDRKEWSTE